MVINIAKSSIKEALTLFKNACFPIAFTGAGISTPSGIPDFRSKGSGLWEKNDPMEVASHTAWENHPERFYDWLKPLILQSVKALPNPAHYALANLETAGKLKAIITQNIDGLHQRAGSKNVIELHGSCSVFHCPNCCDEFTLDEIIPVLKTEKIPECRRCGKPLKPNIILYEESLPESAFSSAENICLKTDLVMVIGSSLEVMPAASLPLTAVKNGAKLIINNFSETPYDSYADVLIRDNVTEFLSQLSGAFA